MSRKELRNKHFNIKEPEMKNHQITKKIESSEKEALTKI